MNVLDSILKKLKELQKQNSLDHEKTKKDLKELENLIKK